MDTELPLRITVPEGITFADLKLARKTTGDVSFDWAPLEAICKESGMDIEIFKQGPEDNVCGLIVAWYFAAQERGEIDDPVAEELVSETLTEMA